VFSAFIAAAAAEPRPFDRLLAPAAGETAAPADAALLAACQASLRERFGRQQLGFARPSHAVNDGTRIIRLDVTAAGQTVRAACSRDGAGGPVEAIVFDAAADQTGPRVIALGGQPAAAASSPAADPGYRYVARDPNAASSDAAAGYPGYGGSYLPGLWVPAVDGRPCFHCRFDGSGAHIFVRLGSNGIETVRAETDRIAAFPRGSSAPFSNGGIASPAISNFTSNVERRSSTTFRSGGIASPTISNFTSKAGGGGGGGRVRAGGGGGARIGR
jgi:hypothetical protein